MKIKKVVIPAAGLGTRMLPATKTVPKEMLPIVDKPAIQYIVEEAVHSGIEHIIILTNRAKTVMEDYFDYSPELETRLRSAGRDSDADLVRHVADVADITFIRQKETLGLGHAVWCARSVVGDEPFAVMLGDDIMRAKTPVIGQLIEAARKHECPVVGVQKVDPDRIEKYCTLDVKPVDSRLFEVSRLIEKPRPDQVLSPYAILGRYVLTPDIFKILEALPAGYNGEIQLTDGLNVLCGQRRMLALDFDGRRYDTGSLTGYLETFLDFALMHPKTSAWLKTYIAEKYLEE